MLESMWIYGCTNGLWDGDGFAGGTNGDNAFGYAPVHVTTGHPRSKDRGSIEVGDSPASVPDGAAPSTVETPWLLMA